MINNYDKKHCDLRFFDLTKCEEKQNVIKKKYYKKEIGRKKSVKKSWWPKLTKKIVCREKMWQRKIAMKKIVTE